LIAEDAYAMIPLPRKADRHGGVDNRGRAGTVPGLWAFHQMTITGFEPIASVRFPRRILAAE
jgi:hypothetical protein